MFKQLSPWICTAWFAKLWERWSHDLLLTGQVQVFLRNSKDHFNNTKIVNFDIIRRQANGDPPDNKTSWRRHSNVCLYVPATSQVRLKWNSKQSLDGTWPRRLRGASLRHFIGTSWRNFKRMSQRRLIGISSRRLKHVSNETPNDVSLALHQDVSVVRIHKVTLVRPYDVSRKYQIKHQLKSLWYVSTKSQSYVVATPC